MFATASIYVNAAPSGKTELSARFLHKLQTCQKSILLHARAKLWDGKCCVGKLTV